MSSAACRVCSSSVSVSVFAWFKNCVTVWDIAAGRVSVWSEEVKLRSALYVFS